MADGADAATIWLLDRSRYLLVYNGLVNDTGPLLITDNYTSLTVHV